MQSVTSAVSLESGDYGRTATQRRVRWYQSVLRHAAGYASVPLNGNHNDPVTRTALRDFQTRIGVNPTGYLGDVRVNNALTQAGLERIYLNRLATAPGSRDETLVSQIRTFQADYGLVADGKVGENTQRMMTEVLAGVHSRPVTLRHRDLGPVGTESRDGLQAAAPGTALSDVRFRRMETWNPHMITGGTDNRECVYDTTKPPYRYICLIEARKRVRARTTFKQLDLVFGVAGTGVLISPWHVLTAAHVVKGEVLREPGGEERGLIAEAIEARVTPGYNGFHRGATRESRRKRRPFGTYHSSLWFYPNCWTGLGWRFINCRGPRCDFDTGTRRGLRQWADGNEILSDNADFALLTLQKPVTSGYWGETPNFRIEAADPIPMYVDAPKAYGAGYPVKAPNDAEPGCNVRRQKMQWLSQGTIDLEHVSREYEIAFREEEIDFASEPNLFIHDLDFTMGNSGGPMWTARSDDRGNIIRSLVGILTGGFRKYTDYAESYSPFNQALALTDDVLCQVAEWASDVLVFKRGSLQVKS